LSGIARLSLTLDAHASAILASADLVLRSKEFLLPERINSLAKFLMYIDADGLSQWVKLTLFLGNGLRGVCANVGLHQRDIPFNVATVLFAEAFFATQVFYFFSEMLGERTRDFACAATELFMPEYATFGRFGRRVWSGEWRTDFCASV
jgi:hypothetical protein